MSKRVKKKVRMTIKQESDDDLSADHFQSSSLENMEVDDEDRIGTAEELRVASKLGRITSTELLQLIEGDSSVKLVKNVVRRIKEIAKSLQSNGGDKENFVELLKQLSEKVANICEKHARSIDKVGKFLSKIFPDDDGSAGEGLSCESDFFKTVLKYGMNAATNTEGGASLVRILQAVISVGAVGGKVQNPTLGIQMIVSHSSAADIFLESHQFVKTSSQSKRPDVKPELKKGEGTAATAPSQPEMKYSEIKTQLLKLWRNLVVAFTKVSKTSGTSNDKKILENSVPYLFQMYGATMSEADQEIFQILREYTGKRLQISIESMPLFGPKSLEPLANPTKASNPLFAHSSRANTVLALINERQAYQTAMEFKESSLSPSSEEINNPRHYDFRFLLPLVCHALDARNICDAVKVISHGWIYLIVRGLSLEDEVMRNMSFLAYKLLIQNFQLPKKGYKVQDIKVWLHFLLSVRKGMQSMEKCKISNLLSTWMVASWECIRQPAHPMYQRLTTLLFAKPVIVLSVLPDFLPFYNAADGNRATREWILNILYHGLQTREDWQVAQKLPTINALCSSFLVEKVFVQRQILRILLGGATIPEVAQEMVDKHSLLIWIANISLHKRTFGKELLELFRTLRENCPENECRQLLFQYVSNVHGWTDVCETM